MAADTQLAAPSSRPVHRLPVDPLGVVGLLGLLIIWWAIAYFQLVPAIFVPPPADVARSAAENFLSSRYLANFRLGSGGLAASLLYTIENVVLALLVACVCGIALGLGSARSGRLRSVLDPIVMTAGTIPILVTAPFFLIWFGPERSAQVALLIVYDTTLVYMFAQRAVGNLDPIYEAAARTFRATRRRSLVDVYLKGTLPEVFGGIRIALAGAWGLEAFAELLGAPEGIGKVIHALASATDVPTIMATIGVLAVVAVVFDAAAAGVFGFVTRWRPEATV